MKRALPQGIYWEEQMVVSSAWVNERVQDIMCGIIRGSPQQLDMLAGAVMHTITQMLGFLMSRCYRCQMVILQNVRKSWSNKTVL